MNLAALDYPADALAPFGRERILMEAENEVELLMRITACTKEPWTVEFIESMEPGAIFWDLGANVGPYTLIAAARGLGVVAFEPVPETAAALSRNLALNDMLNQVILLPVGLSDGHGLLWLHRSDMRAGAASHVVDSTDRATPTEVHRQLIPVMTLDDAWRYFSLPAPNAIKLDVDGFEIPVLAGAEAVLALPELQAMMIELHDQWDGRLMAWLKELGWELAQKWDHRGPIYYGRFERAGALANRAEHRNGHDAQAAIPSRNAPPIGWMAPH